MERPGEALQRDSKQAKLNNVDMDGATSLQGQPPTIPPSKHICCEIPTESAWPWDDINTSTPRATKKTCPVNPQN